MAFEKRLKEVPPQLFTADGTVDGIIKVSEACLFRVKQRVIIKATSLDNLLLEIKSIPDATTLIVGPRGGSIRTTTDVSAYTVALNASIEAKEQLHPAIPIQEIERFEYEEEPVVAKRTILVDKLGDLITSSNPLPVSPVATIATTGEVFNVSMPIKNTEYSFVLPSGCVTMLIRTRNRSKMRLAFVAGGTNSIYWTIMPGAVLPFSGINSKVNTTLYLQSTKDNTTAEIIVWR